MSDTTRAVPGTGLSVNALAAPLVARLLAQADEQGLLVEQLAGGVTIVDAGIDAAGSVEAGLLIGEICMGGLGRVGLAPGGREGWPDWLEVSSARPVLSCLGSQYAGWSLAASKEEAGGKKFFALGSGPARALSVREDLFAELGYRDHGDSGVLVLEVDRRPPQVVIDKVLDQCGLAPGGLTLVLTPTSSLAGTTQVVGRRLSDHRPEQTGKQGQREQYRLQLGAQRYLAVRQVLHEHSTTHCATPPFSNCWTSHAASDSLISGRHGGMAVPGRPLRMVLSRNAAGLPARSPGNSAGPRPPRRVNPWQEPQSCFNSRPSST